MSSGSSGVTSSRDRLSTLLLSRFGVRSGSFFMISKGAARNIAPRNAAPLAVLHASPLGSSSAPCCSRLAAA
eukprot:6360207-Prymnesium_polylepis.1